MTPTLQLCLIVSAALFSIGLLTSAGSLDGSRIIVSAGGPTITLPPLKVAVNDLVMVHFGDQTGLALETTAKDQYPDSTHARHYDLAWDVPAGTAGPSAPHTHTPAPPAPRPTRRRPPDGQRHRRLCR